MGQNEPVPELPEVQALVDFLAERVVGLAVTGVELGSFSVLKTFDPPPQALEGVPVDSVSRHGKFVDLDCDGVHLVFHLARAGWLRWSDALPHTVLRPGKSPIALRVRFSDASGFDLTEAGTKKRLAAYLVRDVDRDVLHHDRRPDRRHGGADVQPGARKQLMGEPEADGGVVVPAGEQYRRTGVDEPRHSFGEQLNRLGSRHGAVVDVARDEDGVHLLRADRRHQVVDQPCLRVEQPHLVEGPSQMPVGGVEEPHTRRLGERTDRRWQARPACGWVSTALGGPTRRHAGIPAGTAREGSRG